MDNELDRVPTPDTPAMYSYLNVCKEYAYLYYTYRHWKMCSCSCVGDKTLSHPLSNQL